MYPTASRSMPATVSQNCPSRLSFSSRIESSWKVLMNSPTTTDRPVTVML
jgi:hypothetical protein